VSVLNNSSDNNYIVGGAVRDMMSDITPHDYDMVTDIPMDVLAELFVDCGFSVTKTGVAHFVLNVSFGGFEVEISNFRKDASCDGRHAVVEVGSIVEDAFRRDFTINAVYLNVKNGEIFDVTGLGVDDIINKKLRFIGSPKDRIVEDYLRVFRFYRFVNKGFTPDKKSLRAVRELFSEAYEKTTPERVRVEMEKMNTRIIHND